MLKTAPAVFAVGENYQICVQVEKPSLFWVKIGDSEYCDAANGIMRSASALHRVTVPQAVLDAACAYTVCVRPLVERRPYFTETAPVECFTYAFSPVPPDGARAYHIADAHNAIDAPVAAARAFGEIDFLVLNGDVIDHSGDPSKFDNIYTIAAALTGGSIPTVFSRGNHDMRGEYAEQFAAYTPNDGGNTYYTFRLGSIWGVVLDCGEDKPDDHPEYGHTVACHAFREQQTVFLHQVIRRADTEYAAPGVSTRLVIVHNPFTERMAPPFDIEDGIFGEWTRLLREAVQPDLMLCGHLHTLEVRLPGHEKDHRGQPCPVVVGAAPRKDGFTGCGIVCGKNEFAVTFSDSDGTTRRQLLPRKPRV